MKKIALEEHFHFPDMIARIGKDRIAARGWPSGDAVSPSMKGGNELLADLEEKRLQSMDESGITMQVLSAAGPGADLLPPDEAIPFAREYNDRLKKLVDAHPARFAGFAHLPVTSPDAAAAELERAVTGLQFRGALINGTTDGLFLDHESYAPLLQKAEQLDVPLYLHPSFPPPAVREAYYGGLKPAVGSALASAAFGWHAEVAIHILRLYASGTLDRYPHLQLIIGHMGEMLPFMMYRTEAVLPKSLTGVGRTFSEVLRSQVHITTSGLFTVPPLRTAIDTFGTDRILFSVDYPFSDNRQGKAFIDSLPIAMEDVERIAFRNAARLLKIDI